MECPDGQQCLEFKGDPNNLISNMVYKLADGRTLVLEDAQILSVRSIGTLFQIVGRATVMEVNAK